MSNVNKTNRPHVAVNIGALSATKEIGLIHAQKKMRIHAIKITDITIVAAHATNIVTSNAKIDGVDQAGIENDTILGLAARAGLDLPIPAAGLYLEAGELLSLNMVVGGTGAYSNVSVHVDAEIIGN